MDADAVKLDARLLAVLGGGEVDRQRTDHAALGDVEGDDAAVVLEGADDDGALAGGEAADGEAAVLVGGRGGGEGGDGDAAAVRAALDAHTGVLDRLAGGALDDAAVEAAATRQADLDRRRL